MNRYRMPRGPVATRRAAWRDLDDALNAASCAVRLLQRHRLDPAARELVHAALRSLDDADRARRWLGDGGPEGR